MSAPTEQDVTKLLEAEERAKRDSDYADSIKMDVQLITGTRYKFRFSETQPER